MLLQSGGIPEKLAPAQYDGHLVGLHDCNPRKKIKHRHDGHPPVHALPGAVKKTREGRGKALDLGRRPLISHLAFLVCTGLLAFLALQHREGLGIGAQNQRRISRNQFVDGFQRTGEPVKFRIDLVRVGVGPGHLRG